MTSSLEKLWNITGIDRSEYKDEYNGYFEPIGLILLKDPICFEYWCTPENTITFATTGGDGVHYGFLVKKDVSFENSPIVMTLPSAETSNIIISKNFDEFLSFGCRLGYFVLEQIEYQPEIYLSLLDSHSYLEEATKEEIRMLKTIERSFNLKPLNHHKKRLEELKLKYFSSLKYSKEYYEIKA